MGYFHGVMLVWVAVFKVLYWSHKEGCLQVTLSASLSRAETDQLTPLQLSLQMFHLVINLWCKLDLKKFVFLHNKPYNKDIYDHIHMVYSIIMTTGAVPRAGARC